MNPVTVAVHTFKRDREAVKKAVEDADAFRHLSKNATVVIKPNIVVWIDAPYPKWGVITTSVIMKEVVKLLRDYGVKDISIAEGSLQMNPKNKHIGRKAYQDLGYELLEQRYGVRLLDVWERPFRKVEVSTGLNLKVNTDLLDADFLVNLPVLKTHAQVKVSLGIKNIKGFLDVNSRKKCHSSDHKMDLEYMISCLPKFLPPSATIIDGIYSLERGPSFDGKSRKSDIIVASSNLTAADIVGAKLLGYDPEQIPYIKQAALNSRLSTSFSEQEGLAPIKVVGRPIEEVKAFHEYTFPYNEDNTLPVNFEKMGIKGLKFHKYDTTLCTYCSPLIGMLLTAIAMTYKGKPFDDVEFLTGKRQKPSLDMKKSVLVGQCMCRLNKNHEGPQQIIKIKGCPPDPKEAASALKSIGIEIDASLLTNFAMLAGFYMERFKGKPDFDESYYTII